jgi:hypothetical protein
MGNRAIFRFEFDRYLPLFKLSARAQMPSIASQYLHTTRYLPSVTKTTLRSGSMLDIIIDFIKTLVSYTAVTALYITIP